jgi:predicted Zn-dependent protease
LLLAGLVALGLGIGAVGYLAVDRWAGDADAERPDRASAAGVAAQLEALQAEVNAAMNDGQALPRLEARVRDFTRRHPGPWEGHLLLAQVRLRLSMWEPAYDSLTRALADQPESEELNRLAGDCAAKLGRLEQAERHYRAAIAAAGEGADSDMHAALGRLYLATDRVDLAEQAFNNSIAARYARGQDVNWRHKGHAGLADVASLRGDFDTALTQIDQALRFAESDSQADVTGYRIQKARLYMDAGRDDEAATMLAYAWSQEPEAQWRIESARLRATLFERAGEMDKAVNHVKLVCDMVQLSEDRRDDTLANLYALLARWQIKAGRTDAARLALDNARTLWPDQPQLDALRAQLK